MNVTNTMEHDGHQAIITYCNDIESFRGEILGLTGVVDFYADSVEGLKMEFKKSIDTYLEVCEGQGITPYLGNHEHKINISFEDVETVLGSGSVMKLVDYLNK